MLTRSLRLQAARAEVLAIALRVLAACGHRPAPVPPHRPRPRLAPRERAVERALGWV